MGAADEVHSRDGDAVHRGIGGGDGPPDGHGEVLVQLGSCLRAGDGGYHVLEKWVKDRKGRTLSHDDVTRYGRIVVALRETIRLTAEIDEVVPWWPIG